MGSNNFSWQQKYQGVYMKQKNRTTLFVVLAVFVVIIVVYFSFFYPLPSSKNLTGTMIGIEKSKREIGDQITIEEIIIENPEINDVIQSAEFQNLIKDENFRKMALSSDFQICVPHVGLPADCTFFSRFSKYCTRFEHS